MWTKERKEQEAKQAFEVLGAGGEVPMAFSKQKEYVLHFLPAFKRDCLALSEISTLPDGKVGNVQSKSFHLILSDGLDELERYFKYSKHPKRLRNFRIVPWLGELISLLRNYALVEKL